MGGILSELFFAGGGDRVELGLAIVVRGAPVGVDPTALLQADALQRCRQRRLDGGSLLLGLGAVLWLKRAALSVPGLKFRWFMVAYLSFRLYIDFFKPHWTLFAGLSGIQWGCALALVFCVYSLMKISEQPLTEKSHG